MRGREPIPEGSRTSYLRVFGENRVKVLPLKWKTPAVTPLIVPM